MLPQIVLLLCAFTQFVHAWSEKDYELFELKDAVEKAEGTGVTFYDWLDVSPYSSNEELTKSYRKLSRKLHPDKAPKKQKKVANERFSRLSVVISILRDPEMRERYDYFLKHGFPKWRGTGYYYRRLRPGLGSVLVLLVCLFNWAHYGIIRMNARGHRRHMQYCIDTAREVAEWPEKVQTLKKVQLYNGKVFSVKASGKVSLLEIEDGVEVEYPLDTDEIQMPTWRDTFVYLLYRKLYSKLTNSQTGDKSKGHKLGLKEAKKTAPKPSSQIKRKKESKKASKKA
ncbi:hypothetical protein CANCADRAFT_44370 [Tortispora caseinolytica NRRL Y-17796]|uniref:J domain-containing protein n=1 Tax=Tortispora caseinolytica NRRL Y-17796 TaxID=767744 RepID=A0A1E4TG29_9ASCO|nr:hypothetical protein CANCADRAFT_44370 [Tortispora caseinolytica NRRL Y-17796]